MTPMATVGNGRPALNLHVRNWALFAVVGILALLGARSAYRQLRAYEVPKVVSDGRLAVLDVPECESVERPESGDLPARTDGAPTRVTLEPGNAQATAGSASTASAAINNPLDSLEAAKVLKSEFGYWIGMARSSGLTDVPQDFLVPGSVAVAVAAECNMYNRAVQAIDTVRIPTLDSIAERKVAAGISEQYEHPDRIQDIDAKRAAERVIRAARKPSKPGQSVIVGGEAGYIRITRVDLSDDPSLSQLQQSLEEARRAYIQNVYRIIAPHLTPR